MFLVDGAEIEPSQAEKFERIFNIFDGTAEQALQQARNLWKTYKESGFDVKYWQQDKRGVWQLKA